jgi:prevent-host-death family protein
MKVVSLGEANLEKCVRAAQRERVVLTRQGKPVAVLISAKGLDLEQIELGYSDEFWALIRRRRAQKTMSRETLEKRLAGKRNGRKRDGDAGKRNGDAAR